MRARLQQGSEEAARAGGQTPENQIASAKLDQSDLAIAE
jgi:hypothetical protein